MMPENVVDCTDTIASNGPEVDNCCYRCRCTGEITQGELFGESNPVLADSQHGLPCAWVYR